MELEYIDGVKFSFPLLSFDFKRKVIVELEVSKIQFQEMDTYFDYRSLTPPQSIDITAFKKEYEMKKNNILFLKEKYKEKNYDEFFNYLVYANPEEFI